MTTTNDINTAAVRDDVIVWAEGTDIANLPEQGFGNLETLLPAVYTFKLPEDLQSLWHDGNPVENKVPGSPTFGQQVIRPYLKFDKAHPLVVFGGEHDGVPFTAVVSTNPRPRGKKDDPKTPYISDATYLLNVALADKRKPTSLTEQQAFINAYGGKTIRVRTGLSAFCNPEKVRYVLVEIPGGPGESATQKSVEDPNGTRGCGQRVYTKGFKLPDGTFTDQTYCGCGAYLRGFAQIEEFLPPSK